VRRHRQFTKPSPIFLAAGYAERLVRRLIAQELILSFVPDGEQRTWRTLTRMKLQLRRDRVRVQNQMECLLEEMRIKLSIVVSDLLGASGLRMLLALAKGESDPKKLAQLGDERLRCTEEQLVDALTGRPQPMYREMLALQLERAAADRQSNRQAQRPDRASHEAASRGGDATGGSTRFGSGFGATDHRGSGRASQYISLGGGVDLLGGNLCRKGRKRAEQNHSSRSAKGNKYLRRVLNQAAHAAVKNNGSYFQAVFRRLLPRLGYQSAIWAVAHRLCRLVWKILHEGVRFIEQGREPDPRAKKKRAQMLARALRKLGYEVTITPINPAIAENGKQI
jgi:transposase